MLKQPIGDTECYATINAAAPSIDGSFNSLPESVRTILPEKVEQDPTKHTLALPGIERKSVACSTQSDDYMGQKTHEIGIQVVFGDEKSQFVFQDNEENEYAAPQTENIGFSQRLWTLCCMLCYAKRVHSETNRPQIHYVERVQSEIDRAQYKLRSSEERLQALHAGITRAESMTSSTTPSIVQTLLSNPFKFTCAGEISPTRSRVSIEGSPSNHQTTDENEYSIEQSSYSSEGNESAGCFVKIAFETSAVGGRAR